MRRAMSRQTRPIPIVASCPAVNAVDLQVVEINVKEGDAVSANQVIMLLEFRKAVVEIAAPVDAIVEKVHVAVWDEVQVGDVLVELMHQPTRRPRAVCPKRS